MRWDEEKCTSGFEGAWSNGSKKFGALNSLGSWVDPLMGMARKFPVHPSEGWGADHKLRRLGRRTGSSIRPAESSIWTPAFAGVHGGF